MSETMKYLRYESGKEALQDVLFRMAYKDARQFGKDRELESLKRIYPERFAECESRYNRDTI